MGVDYRRDGKAEEEQGEGEERLEDEYAKEKVGVHFEGSRLSGKPQGTLSLVSNRLRVAAV